MKNIEKLAIDHIINNIKTEQVNKATQISEAKAAIQEAKDYFTGLAKGIITDIKESTKEIEDEISEEGIEYLDKEISSYFGFPFKLKS